MACLVCSVCKLGLRQKPPASDDTAVVRLRPARLQGVKVCAARCGHAFHVDCFINLGSTDNSQRKCPICSRIHEMDLANPLMCNEETSDAALTPPLVAQDGTGNASPSQHIHPTSTQSGGDLNATNNQHKHKPPNPPPSVMERILKSYPALRPHLTAQQINKLDKHINQILMALHKDGLLGNINAVSDYYNQRMDLFGQVAAHRGLSDEEMVQLRVNFARDLFLSIHHQNFTEEAISLDATLVYLSNWLNDNA